MENLLDGTRDTCLCIGVSEATAGRDGGGGAGGGVYAYTCIGVTFTCMYVHARAGASRQVQYLSPLVVSFSR